VVTVGLLLLLARGIRRLAEVIQEATGGATAANQRPMTTIWYRTQDGQDYQFGLDCRGSGFRIYVLAFASERAKGSAPHLLRDRRGGYICWTKSIQTEEAALAVAAQWADNVQRYVKTGQGF
jgi:hypothetical protein